MSGPRMGRASIFRGKDAGRKFHGVMTPYAGGVFEQARTRLGKLAGRPPEKVSDADTMEYLARGERDTVAYLRKTGQLAA